MVFDTFFHAARSVLSGFCRPRRDQPGTSLRTLCVAAFDFTARADGQRLGPEKRRALNSLLDLGALINDHFDEHRFCKSQLPPPQEATRRRRNREAPSTATTFAACVASSGIGRVCGFHARQTS